MVTQSSKEVHDCLRAIKTGNYAEIADSSLVRLPYLVEWLRLSGDNWVTECGRASSMMVVSALEKALRSLGFPTLMSHQIEGDRSLCEGAVELRAKDFRRFSPEAKGLVAIYALHVVDVSWQIAGEIVGLEQRRFETVRTIGFKSVYEQIIGLNVEYRAYHEVERLQVRTVATEEDIIGIHYLDQIVYSESSARATWPVEELMFLREAFPQGIQVVVNGNDVVVGYAIVLPMNDSFVDDYICGRRTRIEEWTPFNDCLNTQEASEQSNLCILIDNIAVIPHQHIRQVVAWKLIRSIKESIMDIGNCQRVCAHIVSDVGRRFSQIYGSRINLICKRPNGKWGDFMVWEVSRSDWPFGRLKIEL